MGDQFVVVAGNVVDGVRIFGPFDDANTAGDWASFNINDEDWVCTKLLPVQVEV